MDDGGGGRQAREDLLGFGSPRKKKKINPEGGVSHVPVTT